MSPLPLEILLFLVTCDIVTLWHCLPFCVKLCHHELSPDKRKVTFTFFHWQHPELLNVTDIRVRTWPKSGKRLELLYVSRHTTRHVACSVAIYFTFSHLTGECATCSVAIYLTFSHLLQLHRRVWQHVLGQSIGSAREQINREGCQPLAGGRSSINISILIW